jgi:hypothetical protein
MSHEVDTFEEEVIDRLARIETTVASMPPRLQDQETRIRNLEKRQWMLSGAAAVLGATLSKFGIHIPLPF